MGLGQDLRFSVRGLRRTPTFTAVAVLTLALGIGASTAIFSFFSALVLEPLPFEDSRGLIVLNKDNPRFDFEGLWPEAADWERWRGATGFRELSGFKTEEVNLVAGEAVHRVRVGQVLPGLLDLVGREPVLGRGFVEDDFEEGAAPAVILSHALWRERFGADEEVLGRSVRLDDQEAQVIGVLAPGPPVPLYDVQLVEPLALTASQRANRGEGPWILGVGRLRPGATLEGVSAELLKIQGELEDEQPTGMDGWVPMARRLPDRIVGNARQPVAILLGAVLLVLLIACANVASLLVARARRRRAELAVRSALGASRGRILVQLMVESLVLATTGGALGVLLSFFLVRLLVGLAPASLPRLDEVAVGGGVLAFAVLLTLATSLVFGLLPALGAARTRLGSARGSTDAGPGLPVREALVVGQVAVALLLLVGAGLLMQSLAGLLDIDPGFETERLVRAEVTVPAYRYPEPAQQVDLLQRVLEEVGSLPAVDTVAASSWAPLSGSWARTGFILDERSEIPDEERFAYRRLVSDHYFVTMGVSVLEGRTFVPTDRRGATGPNGADGGERLVAVVNRHMAERFWPDGAAVGGRFKLDSSDDAPWLEVVGVVGDERQVRLTDEPRSAYYVPYRVTEHQLYAFQLLVRTEAPVDAVQGSLRAALRQLDPELPVASLEPLSRVVDDQLARPRFQLFVLAALALVALALASVGLYGVITYNVAQRVREIGIRLALGADGRGIARLVGGRALSMVGLGLALGLVAAIGATRLLASMLHGVRPTDPVTYLAVSLLMLAVTTAAVLGPVRRASRVDPVEALRRE